MDTSYFRAIGEGIIPQLYVELDFPDVTTRKASIIRKHDMLQKCLRGEIPTQQEIIQAQSNLSAAFHQSPVSATKANNIPSPLQNIRLHNKIPSVHGLSFGGQAATIDPEGHIHALTSTSSSTSSSTNSGGSTTSVPTPVVTSPLSTTNEASKIPMSPSSPSTTTDASSSTTSSTTFTPTADGGINIHSKYYRLATADLRDIEAVHNAVKNAGIDFTVPTLLLSECVLVYLEPEESCSIIAWAARTFQHSVFVTYEQIRPHDAFGRVMAKNLEERGYTLRGLHAFPDIPAQTSRYKELGYQACTVIDMNDIYYRILPKQDIARIERLEIFDEIEEWHLMSAHYAIAVAVNDKNSNNNQTSTALLTPSSINSNNQSVPLSAERKGREKTKYIPEENISAKRSNTDAAHTPNSHHHGHPDSITASSSSSSTNSIHVTDMPAPAPKIPRTGSYSSSSSSVTSSTLSTPISSTLRSTMEIPALSHPHPTTSTSALSPIQLAVAVVTAHELEEGVARERRNSIRSMSTSPNPSIGRRSRSRSLSIAADSDMESNSVITGLHDMTNMSLSSAGRHRHHPSSHTITSPSGHSTNSSHSLSTAHNPSSSLEHDHIVVDAHEAIDFHAIAESEEEIDNARYIRNIAGIDNNQHMFLHPLSQTSSLNGANNNNGSRSSSRASNSTTSSHTGTHDVSVSAVTNEGAVGFSATLLSNHSPVVHHQPSNLHIHPSTTNTVTGLYDITSIMESTHPVTLMDSLFPIHKWNDVGTTNHVNHERGRFMM